MNIILLAMEKLLNMAESLAAVVLSVLFTLICGYILGHVIAAYIRGAFQAVTQ